MTSIHIKTALQCNPTTSKWLYNALQELSERDICDCLNDVEHLQKYLKLKAQESGL